MEKQIITFSANEQILKKTAGKDRFADDVVGYIEAHFDLGDNWTGYDSVRAVWFTAFAQISTVLDQNGVCLVPPEVCNRKEAVNVNLVGSIIENNELTDRLTTYPIEAFIFDGNARVDGSETVPVTPSQFEQYVAIVEALVGSVKDIDHAALNADYTLTIYYSDGTQDTVGPIRGEQGPTGPTGNGIASIAKTGTSGTNPVVDTYTITYTNGQTTTFTVTNGVKGDTGNGIQSIYKTGTAGAVDTYTILYTDGNTTEFTVTNGEVTNAVLTAAIDQAKEDLVDQFAVKDTASGSIASFPDGADWPAKNVLADIDPVQDLNGYSKPWPAGGNVNLLDPTKKTTYDGSNGLRWYQADGFTLKANQAYTFKYFQSASENVTLYVRAKSDGSFLANAINVLTYTPSEDTVVYLQAYRVNISQNDNQYMLVKGSTAPISWTPYSNICPISGRTECDVYVSPTTSEQDATVYTTALGRTVYGGTLDVVSGELVVDRAIVDLGTLFWNTSSAQTADGSTCYFVTISGMDTATANTDLLAEEYVCASSKYISAMTGGTMIRGNGYLYIASNSPTISGKCVYPLATPQTYQLTPAEVELLLGANNVWADTGDIEVTYVADTKLYIDKMTA